MKNINLGAHFLFLVILCSIKIERLLLLKILKNLALFDSYFWPFNKSEEKIKVIFVISAIIPSIWNVFIKFRSHDEKLTYVPPGLEQNLPYSLSKGSPHNVQNNLIIFFKLKILKLLFPNYHIFEILSRFQTVKSWHSNSMPSFLIR